MGQVLTNNTGHRYARESSLGVLPGSPDWKDIEPNTIDESGPQFDEVERQPISDLLQDRKGTNVGLTANRAFGADTTLDSMLDFAEAFFASTAKNSDMTFRAADGQTGPAGFTIPSATAAQAAKFQYTAAGPISLVHAAGYVTTANNSGTTLFEIAADVGATDTVIEVTGITAETAPTNAEVSLAGIRAEEGDLALSVASNIGTLTSGNNSSVTPIDFTTIGITVGQKIHIGGFATTNRFGSTAGGSNDSFGSMRVRTIAAGTITGDKLDATLTASDGTDDGSGGTEVQVDILFGRFVRNVRASDADYAVISHQFESALPNLFETEPPTPVANPDGFVYDIGQVPNLWTFNMGLRDKATSTFAFIGTDSEDPVNNASRKSGASTSRLPLFTEPFNTSSNFLRLILADVDDTGLASDFKDTTLTINRNVTPEDCLGLFGPRYLNNGNFQVRLESEVLFTNYLIPARIRAKTTVSMDWILRNSDGAVAMDIPSATASSDGILYEANRTVRIGLSLKSFVDPLFETSMSASFFPAYPTS